jgi:hypothetical protein
MGRRAWFFVAPALLPVKNEVLVFVGTGTLPMI